MATEYAKPKQPGRLFAPAGHCWSVCRCYRVHSEYDVGVVALSITDDEYDLLLRHKVKSTVALGRTRAEAVLLASENMPVTSIASLVGRQTSTITYWTRQWRKTRMASIVCGSMDNTSAAKLTMPQRAEIAEILQTPPSPMGIPRDFWDIASAAGAITTRFGFEYQSPGSYQFVLRVNGLSFHPLQNPDGRHDDATGEQQITRIPAEIAPLMDDPGWRVYAADEVRLEQETETRRASCQKDSASVLLVSRERHTQTYFGALDMKSGNCHLVRLEQPTEEHVLDALYRLFSSSAGKKICIVWGNAAWHETKAIRDQLGENRSLSHVRLVTRPPHSPGSNLIGRIWGWSNAHAADLQEDTFDDTCTRFEDAVTSRSFRHIFPP